MAVTERSVRASPSDVWAVLADGWRFSNWVVGNSHVRAVDDAWPAVGARLLHTSGPWPLALMDSTEVVESREPARLVLQARGRPAGEATVEMMLTREGGGTRVRITERPTKGLGALVHNPLLDLAIKARNAEGLRRLANMAEKRQP